MKALPSNDTETGRTFEYRGTVLEVVRDETCASCYFFHHQHCIAPSEVPRCYTYQPVRQIYSFREVRNG